jgi:prepilin-type N-terminal cleavage/methylation domain-containing protein
MKLPFKPGFTLAELLIALAILGVIATFTIPKVLQSQQDGRYKAMAKEAAGIVSEAYQTYRQNNGISATFNPNMLSTYLNYVKVTTTGFIDSRPPNTSWPCNAVEPCYLLHNGGTLQLYSDICFGGTASTNGVWFAFDPDSVYGGTTNGPGKAIHMALYASGRLATASTVDSFALMDWGCDGGAAGQAADPTGDPTWFSWN